MNAGVSPHTTVKCKTCGHDSCHGNYIVDWAKQLATEICSRCRNPL